MSDHAKLSPSAAERWMTCPGSVVLSEGMPEKSSAFAEEGTRAHELAELLLGGVAVVVKDADMLQHVNVYVDHVLDLSGQGSKLHVEVKVKVTDQIWGTADAIVWRPDTSTLYVRDLKYGAGVAVEVHNNLQLKIYALAALLTMGYPAKVVDVGIVQPRCPHSDGPIRSTQFDAVDLIDFHADLLDAAERVLSAVRGRGAPVAVPSPAGMAVLSWEEHYLKPSEKGCRWCLAAPKCPAVKSKAQELAKVVFAPKLAYSPEQLAETLEWLPILEGWIKNTREFAYEEAERGHPIPNHKLVEKRASRKWLESIDKKALADALGVGLVAIFKPEELLPVGDLTKLAPGKNAAERESVLAPFTIKESSGHTLVHESDKRPAIRVDAKAAFAEVANR